MSFQPHIQRVGVLGGGQLGKMLSQAGSRWDLNLWLLDKDKDFPAGTVNRQFVEGDFKDFQDVYVFGKQVDVLTIEIEAVNTEAMLRLEEEGIEIHPAPKPLQIIKDKGLQKQFYREHQLPTSDFQLYESKEAVIQALKDVELVFPFVQKSRTEGYDGRGVAIIKGEEDLPKLLDSACVVEKLVDIDKELAVIVAANKKGDIQSFPVVEMAFHPTANLVEFLLCPARVDAEVAQRATELAERVIKAYDIKGLLAVELFLTKSGDILVNEVAPRPHNSGHHTIESCATSQFEQHLRAILNLPLGDTHVLQPAAMVNVLGDPGYEGPVRYEGLDEIFQIPQVFPHLYGKQFTRPYRKMGHITVLGDTIEEAIQKARTVQQLIKVKA
jgi:5-(carboxyamino)imidazole ribonucleotide synthase